MAKNKIMFEQTCGADGRFSYNFTGSLRQPTLIEVRNFIQETRLYEEIGDYFGVAHLPLTEGEWALPEENRTLTLEGYDGGQGDGSCPVCGRERNMCRDVCPVCFRKWENE